MATFIRQRRKEIGITVPEIARALDISETAVWNWDRGRSLPRQEYIGPLALALKVTVQTLTENLKRIKSRPGNEVRPVDKILERARKDLAAYLDVEPERIQLELSIKTKS